MGLIGWWPLHESSGRANDLSGKGNHGTVSGATQGVAGKGGLKSYYFNGSSDYVGIPPTLKDPEFSVSLWVYIESESSRNICFSQGGTYIDVDTSNPILRWYVACSSNSPSCTLDIAESGEWYHIVGTYRKDELAELYVNGEKVDSDTPSGDFTNGSNQLNIGRYQGSSQYYTNGNVSDVRVYDHALTPSEIRELYELGGKASAPEDGISRYKFNGDVTDSWHSNDGTINGDPQFVTGEHGQALNFDGTNDYIDLGTPTEAQFTSGDSFTVAFWVYPESQSSDFPMPIAYPDSGSINKNWLVLQNDSSGSWQDSLSFRLSTGSTSTSDVKTNQVPKNTWTHVTCVYDSSNSEARIYTNSHMDNSASINFSGTGNYDSGLYLGAGVESSGYYFDGKLDDVRIYDRALKDWEVKAIYRGYTDLANPPGKNDPDAVSRYKFDDETSSGLIDSWGSNDGTDNGTVHSDDSIKGKSINADGTTYVDISSIDNEISSPVTVSLWAKETNSGGNIFDHGSSRFTIDRSTISSGDTTFKIYDGNASNTISHPTNPEAWYHYTATFDGSTMNFYVNGTKVGEQSSGSIDESTQSTNIGRNISDNSHFGGLVDDVRVYSRVLEPHEVQQLYQWGTRGRDMRRLTVNKRAGVTDLNPPTVSFSNPSDGETISGTVSVSGNANDSESSIAGMELQIDSSTLTTSNNDTISYDLDTTNYSNGTHNLTITGEDSAGNTGSTSISTTIDNGFIESFEDQSLSEYSGNTGEFSISGTSYDGSYSLHSGQTDGVSIVNTNKSFNDTTTITHWARCSDIYPNMHMLIYAQSSHSGNPNTGYSGYSYGWNSEEFSIYRYDNGSQTILYNSGEILNTGQWYKYVCERNGDTFNLRVEDTSGNVVDSTTVTDSNYTSGYYGFTTHSFSPDEPIYWDYIKIQ